jgi:hypothetical protein
MRRLTTTFATFSLLVLCSYKPGPTINCQQVYNEAVSLEGTNAKRAYQKYFQVCRACEDNAALVLKAYVNVGKLTEKYVNKTVLPDACQFYGQGILSVDTWFAYIKWYSRLPDEQVSLLGNNSTTEIEYALQQVAVLIRKRELLPAGCNEEKVDYSQLFTIYSDTKTKLLTPRNMDTWLEYLTRWKGVDTWGPAESFNTWVSRDSVPAHCEEQANIFFLKLEEWIEQRTLTQPEKRNFTRKLNDLRRFLKIS